MHKEEYYVYATVYWSVSVPLLYKSLIKQIIEFIKVGFIKAKFYNFVITMIILSFGDKRIRKNNTSSLFAEQLVHEQLK